MKGNTIIIIQWLDFELRLLDWLSENRIEVRESKFILTVILFWFTNKGY